MCYTFDLQKSDKVRCIDIITNYNTIFDLIAKIRGKD